MPEQDEFGGTAIDEADEFGGVPVGDGTEEGSLYSAEEGARLQAEAERDAQRVPERVRDTPGDIWEMANRALGKSITPADVAGATDVLDTVARMGAEGVPLLGAPTELQKRLGEQTNRPPTTAEKVIAGVQNVANENLTSPLALGFPIANKFLPAPVAKAVGLAFAANAVEHLPETARAAGEASVTGDAFEKTKAFGNLAMTAAIPAGVALDVAPAARRLFKPGQRATGEPNVESKAAPDVERGTSAETVEKTFVGNKPVEVLEINRKKKTALVVEEGNPDATPEVVKLSDLETKEAYASENGKTAEVYGPLRSQPGEGTGEVPAEEGSRGVQPQTGERLQPAEGQNGEVPLEPLPSIESVEKTIPGERSKPARSALNDLRAALRGLAKVADPAARATLETAARKAIDRYREKRAEVKAPKVERAPDILDEIEQNFGSIRSKKGMRPGQEGYYGEGYNRAYKTGSARKYFSSDRGSSPDEIVDALRREGKLPENATVDDLWDAIEKAANVRKSGKQVLSREQSALKGEEQTRIEFEQAAGDKNKPGVPVDELAKGDKLKIGGEDFTVKDLEFEDEELVSVVLEDGRRFGVQRVDGKQVIHPDRGSIEQAPRGEDWNPEGAPKLREGERQGDLLSKQQEPFKLTGETEKAPEIPKPEPAAPDPAQGDLFARAERGVDETTKPELTEQEEALVADAARMNEHNGVSGEFKLVSETTPEGATPDIAYVRGGKVFINVPVFRRMLRKIPAEQQREFVRSLLNEEGIHAAVQKALPRADLAKLWEGLSKAEQALVLRSYFGKNWKYLSDQLNSAQLGHEYLRRVMQWGMDVNPREVAASRGKGFEWITQKGIDVALKAVHRLRQALGTQLGRNMRTMFDRIEKNLKAAEYANEEKISAKEEEDTPLPLADFKGEMPTAPHYPVLIETSSGKRYEAYLNGYYDFKILGKGEVPSIGKVRPSGASGELGLSHGMLMPDEKIVGGEYPKSMEEFAKAVEANEKPPRTLQEEKLSAMSNDDLENFNKSLAEMRAKSKKHIEKNLADAGEEGGVLMQSNKNPNAKYFISPDISEPGKWRATRFDQHGPSGHHVFKSREAAIRAISGEAFTDNVPGPSYAQNGEFTVDNESIFAKGPVQKTIDDLNTKRKAFATIWRGRRNRDIMDQTIDAADNSANIVGQRMGTRLRIGTDELRRSATMAVIEANGDRSRLNDFLRQSTGNVEAERAVRYAQANWDRLQTDALRARRILDWQISSEQNAGIATEYRDAYVPHIYDRDLLMGAGRPFVIAGGTGTGSGFKKGRTFETIFDAIEAGYTPKTLDVADLVEHRVKTGQKIINRKQWAESLQTLTDPTDGNALAAPLIRKSRGPGQPSYEVAPTGYRPVEILPGVRIGVHEAYLPLFNALTGESFVSGTVPGKILLEGAGAIKHGLLVFDSFHASRIFQKLLFLAPGKVVGGKAGYKRGVSLLEYSDGDLNRAIRERLITPDIAQWVRANRADSNLLIDSGLNVGRIQEALYNSVVRQIPGIGAFNKWVFEKLTRGALMEAGLIELERVSRAKPGVPRGTIAQEVARNLNAYFGNLGRQGIFKSKSAQDIARLITLAPQWVESMARTELKGAAQAVKGVTYDPVVYKTLLTGSVGKGLAQGLLAYFVGTQILNYATRGHSTFQNEEEGHKLDAWIPGPKGSHGFFLSPFSVVAELTHDMLRYSSKEPSKLDAAMRIANNKASPMTRAAKVLMTGRDYDGKQLTDTWNRIKAAGFALAPTPIPLSPMIKGSTYPGQTQRQLLGSAGFKVEPAESAAQQIAHKAKVFMQAHGKKPEAMELTDEPAYYKLRDALRKDDDAGAKQMLDDLRKLHTPKQIMLAMRNHVRRPFTGSRKDEIAFRNTLSDKERGMYDRARDEQRDEYQKFLKIWYK